LIQNLDAHPATDEELLAAVPLHLIARYGAETVLKLLTAKPAGECPDGTKLYVTTRCTPEEMFLLSKGGELVHVKNAGLLQ
jgi:hypothetical protein